MRAVARIPDLPLDFMGLGPSLEIAEDPEQAARCAAAWIASQARGAVASRGVFSFAVSGGSTPRRMLEALGREEVPWSRVQLFQVDERVLPEGHPERNLTHLRRALAGAPRLQLHAMPVDEPDLAQAAQRYERLLVLGAGKPPVLDLVHLGLGTDGHTASLFPGDPVVDVRDASVAVTQHPYHGSRRMTLTLPMLARARRLLWLVTGTGKAAVLQRLLDGDVSMPAARIPRDHALLVVDRDAMRS